MVVNASRNDVCDYVIQRLCAAGECVNLLKLQKLMYYIQAWSLAFYDKPLFSGHFQAWVHGPVNRELYDRFADSKSLYSEVTVEDVLPEFDVERIDEDDRGHIDAILDAYARFTGNQLEDMTHREEPWLKARNGIRPTERCEREIDEQLMATYYRQRLPQQDGQA